MTVIFGGWDWVLYAKISPWRQDFKPFKLNGRYPHYSQFYRDVIGSTSSTLISSLVEICALRYIYTSKGYYSYNGYWSALLMIQTFPYLREIYYYVTHRSIHPWRTKKIPDFGKFLYKHVHSFHHKSYLPTPWNGLSLHPVEGFINIACIFFCIPIASYFPVHPYLITILKYNIALSAAGSHDGFANPGLSNTFHQIHHELFDCNYGDTLIPMDRFFGTAKTYIDMESKK